MTLEVPKSSCSYFNYFTFKNWKKSQKITFFSLSRKTFTKLQNFVTNFFVKLFNREKWGYIYVYTWFSIWSQNIIKGWLKIHISYLIYTNVVCVNVNSCFTHCVKPCNTNSQCNILMRILHFSLSLWDYDLQKKLKILHFKLFIGSYGFLKQYGKSMTWQGEASWNKFLMKFVRMLRITKQSWCHDLNTSKL
jgi:hypothetical protein